MNGSNLPPGCTSADGLTPEEHAWEVLIERIQAECPDVEDAARRWDVAPALRNGLGRLLSYLQAANGEAKALDKEMHR